MALARDWSRPYLAAFQVRFIQMLQYRAAAIAGFMTQCWWGGIKVMVYAAFYNASAHAADAPITLPQVITYTWLAQAFLALAPWSGDPDVTQAMRTGSVTYDRLRPVDAYALWYVRAAGWMSSRAVPRALLMFVAAAIGLPLVGLSEWAWQPPPDLAQAGLFAISLLLTLTLSSAFVMLINTMVVATLNDRGPNLLITPLVIVFSGNLIPLALFPDWLQSFLFVQPLAGVVDIPFRIYSGNLAGEMAWAGIGLQAFWTVAFVVLGRVWLKRVMARLEVQGG